MGLVVSKEKGWTHQENHCPTVNRHLAPYGERVHEWDDVAQHKGRNGGLVEQQLHRAHLKLAVVCADPDRVEGAGKDASKRKNDTQTTRSLDTGIRRGQTVVVADHADTRTCRNQGQKSVPRKSGLVQNKVHEGHTWRQEDSGDLVKGDAGKGQRQIREDDVEGHGDREREDGAERGSPGLEVGKGWSRQDVEGQPCDTKVESRKGELCELE